MEFFYSAVDVLKAILIGLGGGLGLWGLVNLMEGYGNDNPGAKSQGIKQLVAGGAIVAVALMLVPELKSLFEGMILK